MGRELVLSCGAEAGPEGLIHPGSPHTVRGDVRPPSVEATTEHLHGIWFEPKDLSYRDEDLRPCGASSRAPWPAPEGEGEF